MLIVTLINIHNYRDNLITIDRDSERSTVAQHYFIPSEMFSDTAPPVPAQLVAAMITVYSSL